MTTGRAPIYGPETWAIRADRAWSHWDLWFCVVAAREGGDDLAKVESRLISELHGLSIGSSDATEAKLSHLWDLRARLTEARLVPSDLAGDTLTDAKVVEKARRKIATGDLEGRAMTEPMRETPRVRLRRRARFGSWSDFPVSPAVFYDEFRALVVVDRHISKGRTFAITRTLGERLRRLDGPRRSLAERIALYRAFHTAGLELADRADDSYGNVGQMREAAWRTYLDLDWRTAGIAAELRWRDLCELIVWEPYALGFEEETLAYAPARAQEFPLIESILSEVATEHQAVHLRWQEEEARQQIAWLHVAQRTYPWFPGIARSLGSEHWMPIDAMARAALGAGRPEIAVAVFEAADRPGRHQGYLRRLCRELTGARLGDENATPRAALRVVVDQVESP